jgi:hypothetical protein
LDEVYADSAHIEASGYDAGHTSSEPHALLLTKDSERLKLALMAHRIQALANTFDGSRFRENCSMQRRTITLH